jgi:plastocyanin
MRPHWSLRALSRSTKAAGATVLAALLLMILVVACQPIQPAAPSPGPEVDRVGFPENYQQEYALFYEFDRPDNKTARVIYANEQAATVQPSQAFPYGSTLVMEVYRTKRDEANNVLLDDNGRFQREELTGIFVMRKELGFGMKYGDLRNGEWEYVAYRADQSVLTPPERTSSCAACHMEAGQGKDWVFGAYRHFASQEEVAASQPSTNTINLIDYTFDQPVITVTVGSEVIWNSHDVVFHTVTANDGTFSTMLRPHGTFRRTFEQPGEYAFFCAAHSSMNGKIVVTAQ